jgi:hypothetical protein
VGGVEAGNNDMGSNGFVDELELALAPLLLSPIMKSVSLRKAKASAGVLGDALREEGEECEDADEKRSVLKMSLKSDKVSSDIGKMGGLLWWSLQWLLE